MSRYKKKGSTKTVWTNIGTNGSVSTPNRWTNYIDDGYGNHKPGWIKTYGIEIQGFSFQYKPLETQNSFRLH